MIPIFWAMDPGEAMKFSKAANLDTPGIVYKQNNVMCLPLDVWEMLLLIKYMFM